MATNLKFVLLFLALTGGKAHATIVLQFGDSISLGVQPFLAANLPEFDIVHAGLPDVNPPTNNQSTRQWLTIDSGESKPRFERMLDAVPNASVIIANIGIHDMRVDNPSVFGTTPSVYEQNLNTIFDRLEQENVPIVWVTTTPIPSDNNPNEIDPTVQPAYREAELRAVEARDFTVVDVYSLMVDDFEDLYQILPNNLHLNAAGSKFVADQIAPAVTAAIPEAGSLLAISVVLVFVSVRRTR
ncbi:MAG: SGNH/GDSL hydrolase family protein [Pseudomonadota bacterium]